MNTYQWLTLVLGILVGVVLPLLALTLRITVRFASIEVELRKLVDEKERVHAAILEQMTRDRDATDRRLRWLEEHVWRSQGRRTA